MRFRWMSAILRTTSPVLSGSIFSIIQYVFRTAAGSASHSLSLSARGVSPSPSRRDWWTSTVDRLTGESDPLEAGVGEDESIGNAASRRSPAGHLRAHPRPDV